MTHRPPTVRSTSALATAFSASAGFVVVAGIFGLGFAATNGQAHQTAPRRLAQATQLPDVKRGAMPVNGPTFDGKISTLPPNVIDEMTGKSWKPNCPVPLSDLKLLTLTHHTPTGDVATGELVVHVSVAARVLAAFGDLFAAGFPIERMQRIDAYDASDDDSMRANNTSAFNCRPVTGGRGFSKHSYGVAIDINPLINPYVKRRGKTVTVEPESGRPYVERDASVPGLIVKGDVVHRAFTSRGFAWGGTWRRVQDYQHFEAKKPAPTKKAAPSKK